MTHIWPPYITNENQLPKTSRSSINRVFKLTNTQFRVAFKHFFCAVWRTGSYLQSFWPLSTREEQKEDRITLLRRRFLRTTGRLIRGEVSCMGLRAECGISVQQRRSLVVFRSASVFCLCFPYCHSKAFALTKASRNNLDESIPLINRVSPQTKALWGKDLGRNMQVCSSCSCTRACTAAEQT